MSRANLPTPPYCSPAASVRAGGSKTGAVELSRAIFRGMGLSFQGPRGR
jgi:hypothetical protein